MLFCSLFVLWCVRSSFFLHLRQERKRHGLEPAKSAKVPGLTAEVKEKLSAVTRASATSASPAASAAPTTTSSRRRLSMVCVCCGWWRHQSATPAFSDVASFLSQQRNVQVESATPSREMKTQTTTTPASHHAAAAAIPRSASSQLREQSLQSVGRQLKTSPGCQQKFPGGIVGSCLRRS